jgi:hypothetical protein
MSSEPAYLSICAVYRDEGPYLREWVAFHRVMGVDRFFLYNNRSADDHEDALAPYIDEGLVVVHDWPYSPAQIQAYDDCLRRHGEEAHWMAFLDLDEFLFSPGGRPVRDLLPEYEQWPGIGVNWAVFGSSGHKTRPPGLVTESYVWRSEEWARNRHIKSIAKPAHVRAFCTPAFFMYDMEPGVAVDENHRPISLPRGSQTDEVSFAKLRLNHYGTKSEEEFRRKIARGPADSSIPRSERFTPAQLERRAHACNDVEDRDIQVLLPALREELARVGGAVASA